MMEGGGLTSLNLSGNGISDDGAISLAEALLKNREKREELLSRAVEEKKTENKDFGGIRDLCLSKNRVGDKGAKALATVLSLCHLSKVDLGGCQVTDVGAVALADALRNESCSLESLFLANNEIGSEGVTNIAEALQKENTTLTNLSLIGNNFSPYDSVKVALLLADNEKLRGVQLVEATKVGFRTALIKKSMLRFPDVGKEKVISALRKFHFDGKQAASEVLMPLQESISKERAELKRLKKEEEEREKRRRIEEEERKPSVLLERLLREARELSLIDRSAIKVVYENIKKGKFSIDHYIKLWKTRIDSLRPPPSGEEEEKQ
eukprot:g1375.t1